MGGFLLLRLLAKFCSVKIHQKFCIKISVHILTRKIIIDKISYIINTDYKLDKRIDGIEADWVYSAFE